MSGAGKLHRISRSCAKIALLNQLDQFGCSRFPITALNQSELISNAQNKKPAPKSQSALDRSGESAKDRRMKSQRLLLNSHAANTPSFGQRTRACIRVITALGLAVVFLARIRSDSDKGKDKNKETPRKQEQPPAHRRPAERERNDGH